MSDDGEIILQLGLQKGRYADAAVAAESLLAWIDVARDAARTIDPLLDIKVELLGREEGSLLQILRLVESGARTIGEGSSEFPYLRKAAIGLSVAIATSCLGVLAEEMLQPAVQDVALSPRDYGQLVEMTKAIRESAEVSKASMRFFRSIERDPAITTVIVRDGRDDKPFVAVDRRDFAIRGGLYTPEQPDAAEETRTETWSVVLMQAPFYASQKHWGFQHSGRTIHAKMADPLFLQAIVDGTIPISLREGVRMEVRIEWRERKDGKTWTYVPDSRRVIKVLSPLPAPRDAATIDPEESEQPHKDADSDDEGPAS